LIFGKRGFLLTLVAFIFLFSILPTVRGQNFKPDLVPHDPIYIAGDNGFISGNGVVNPDATGTAKDPYVVENWIIDASENHGIYIESTTANFVIRNCVVEKGGSDRNAGIFLYRVQGGRVENNWLEKNNMGIVMWESSNNVLKGNIVENSLLHGINLGSSSDNNVFESNLVENSSMGIHLHFVSNNILKGNLVKNNHSGIFLYSLSDNNIFKNNLVENNFYGFEFSESSNNVLKNNSFENNNYGIRILVSSTNNVLDSNLIKNNTTGLAISASNNVLKNTLIKNNTYGVSIFRSLGNNVIESSSVENNIHSFILYYSSNNVLENNSIKNNSYAIEINTNSENNVLRKNLIENNTYGFNFDNTTKNNLVFRNRIINIREEPCDEGSNFWDNNGMGNYWSDWQPPEHADKDGDGIVDEPRPIEGGNNQDRHPLVMDWETSTFILSSSVNPSDGGSIVFNPPGGEYSSGTEVTVTAEPGEGFKFDRWSGDVSGTSETITVTISADTNITAHFVETNGQGNPEEKESGGIPLIWIGIVIAIIIVIIIFPIMIKRKNIKP